MARTTSNGTHPIWGSLSSLLKPSNLLARSASSELSLSLAHSGDTTQYKRTVHPISSIHSHYMARFISLAQSVCTGSLIVLDTLSNPGSLTAQQIPSPMWARFLSLTRSFRHGPLSKVDTINTLGSLNFSRHSHSVTARLHFLEHTRTLGSLPYLSTLVTKRFTPCD